MSAPTGAPGQVLEARYRLAEVIGVGGMATVHRARDELLARDVAVKVFPPTGTGDDRERQRAEISVLAQLNHPGLVTLLDAGTTGVGVGAQTYIVMELVSGPTLADVLAGGPLTSAQAADVGAQLAAALAAVHQAGVVHRDLKPANVLVADAGWRHSDRSGPAVKLADFGIARLVDAARLTVTGMTMGTATYLSPEQAVGGAVGPAADVYALGLVLLECLTGRKAFTGTVVEVAAARLSVDPEIPPELGRAWTALLAGLTRREPGERPTADEAARSLAELVTRAEPTVVLATRPVAAPRAGAPVPATATATDETAPVRTGTRSPRRRRALGGVGLLLAAAAVAVGVAAWPEPPADEAGVDVGAEVDGPLGDALRDLVASVEP